MRDESDVERGVAVTYPSGDSPQMPLYRHPLRAFFRLLLAVHSGFTSHLLGEDVSVLGRGSAQRPAWPGTRRDALPAPRR